VKCEPSPGKLRDGGQSLKQAQFPLGVAVDGAAISCRGRLPIASQKTIDAGGNEGHYRRWHGIPCPQARWGAATAEPHRIFASELSQSVAFDSGPRNLYGAEQRNRIADSHRSATIHDGRWHGRYLNRRQLCVTEGWRSGHYNADVPIFRESSANL